MGLGCVNSILPKAAEGMVLEVGSGGLVSFVSAVGTLCLGSEGSVSACALCLPTIKVQVFLTRLKVEV